MSSNGTGFGGQQPSVIRNPAWKLADVRNHYSYSNPHSDLYRYLRQWSDLETYLNVGYTRPGAYPAHTNTHLRLIDRLAESLMTLHSMGIHSSDRRLLDVASGRGGPAIHMNRKYGLDVLGVDITPYNVHRADRMSRTSDVWPRVRFVMGSALELPVADQAFTLAWSIESPAHFLDKPAFLRETARVLKPGGAFAFSDLLVVNDVVTGSAEKRQIYEEFLKAWDVPYLETHSSYRENIAQAGFELIRSEVVTDHTLWIFKQACRLFLLLSQIAPLYYAYEYYLRWRTGAELENVRQQVTTSYRALRLGMIDYGLFWAIRR